MKFYFCTNIASFKNRLTGSTQQNCCETSLTTTTNSEIICGQNVGTKVVCGMIPVFKKKAMLKI